MKIVISTSHGGFRLSEDVLKYMGIPYIMTDYETIPSVAIDSLEFRTNPKLIEFIEAFGSVCASGKWANLQIEEIPKGTLFRIQEYDSAEWIETSDDIDWWIAT